MQIWHPICSYFLLILLISVGDVNPIVMSEPESELNIIDALGKPCPMPVLMLKRALKSQNGAVYLLKSSDPHSQIDVARYCQLHQLKYDFKQISLHEFHYLIKS